MTSFLISIIPALEKDSALCACKLARERVLSNETRRLGAEENGSGDVESEAKCVGLSGPGRHLACNIRRQKSVDSVLLAASRRGAVMGTLLRCWLPVAILSGSFRKIGEPAGAGTADKTSKTGARFFL